MTQSKKDFLTSESDWKLSLSKLVGKKIVDIIGYTTEIGGTSVFKLSQILFEGGTSIYVEGEHDLPYIGPDDEFQNLDEETLERLAED